MQDEYDYLDYKKHKIFECIGIFPISKNFPENSSGTISF